jgi:hypothetical protein
VSSQYGREEGGEHLASGMSVSSRSCRARARPRRHAPGGAQGPWADRGVGLAHGAPELPSSPPVLTGHAVSLPPY